MLEIILLLAAALITSSVYAQVDSPEPFQHVSEQMLRALLLLTIAWVMILPLRRTSIQLCRN